MPKLSVCIPAYNAGAYIKETIEMILKQDFEDMEILISDDKSPDNTAEVIKEMLPLDSRIRFVEQEKNLGLAGNWNYLYKEAKGEYFILVCSDDVIMPGALRKKVEVLDQNPDVNIVFSSTTVIGPGSKKIMSRRPFKGDQKFEGKALSKKLFLEKNFMAEPPNNMLRRSAMLAVGEYDKNLWYDIDWDYWIRILQTGNAYYIDEPLAAFRISKTSVSGSSLEGKEKIMSDEQVFIEKYKTGAILPVDDNMIKTRLKNIKKRLFMRIVFMKGLSLFI